MQRPPTKTLALVQFSVIALVTAFAGRARADVYTTYLASTCFPDTANENVTFNADGSVVATGAASITCPIPKTTSGPGVTDDAIFTVEMATDPGGDVTASLDCRIIVYENDLSARSSNLVQVFTEGVESGNDSPTAVGFDFGCNSFPDDNCNRDPNSPPPSPFQTVSNFWSPASGGWYASEMHCKLTNHMKLKSFVVGEHGTDTHKRIYPASSRQVATGDNSAAWHVNPDDSITPDPDGGYLESREVGVGVGGFFSLTCSTSLCSPGDASCTANQAAARAIDFSASSPLNGAADIVGASMANVVCGNTIVGPLAKPSDADAQLIPKKTSFSVVGDTFGCRAPGPGDGRMYSYRVVAADQPAARQLQNGDMKYAVTLPRAQAYAEAFVRVNGVQTISGNIVSSRVVNADGTSTYSRVVPASSYHAGDVINVRFYSYESGGPAVYKPGPLELVSYPDFVYGQVAVPPSSCHHTYERLANGDVAFSYTFSEAKSYVEAFVRRGSTQIAAGNIVQSGVANPDGTFTYRRVVPASSFTAGAAVTFRFYSYVSGHPGVFTPGPAETVWFPGFTYGQSSVSACQ